MQHGDLNIFIMMHQHTKQELISPKKTRNLHRTLKTHVTPLHVLRNTEVPRNPCWRILS